MKVTHGSRVKRNDDGAIFTVRSVVKEYDKETPRYPGDSNPIPAGSVVCRVEGGGMNQKRFSPDTHTVLN